MLINKIAAWGNIGSFFIACVMLYFAWPQSPQGTKGTVLNTSMSSISPQMWTVLALLIFAGFLQLAAAALHANLFRRRSTGKNDRHLMPVPEAKTKKEWTESTGKLRLIANRTFKRTDVILDGRHYFDCSFEDVRFWYDGIQPSMLEQSKLASNSKVDLHTHNPVLVQWTQILRNCGLLSENAQIGLEPFED